jgi:two-component system chemotaxis sensor kinase CheA
VDHGIDNQEERERRGKPAQANIRVSTHVDHDNFIVTVEDDGPGVDWEALRARAGSLGIDPKLLSRRENLVFLPGVSTKKVVTEVSGRGVGMVAVRDACEALGGHVKVESELGHGTRVSFSFPKDQAIYEGHASILQSHASAAA